VTPQERDAWKALLADRALGDYDTGNYLGGGEFGLVFDGRERATGDVVALKVLLPGAPHDSVAEFQNEGELLGQLQKASGVVDLLRSTTTSIEVESSGIRVPLQVHFHALELATGCLEELLIDEHQRSRLAWSERLALWRGVILGVHQMHLKQIAHRDIKSSNCLLHVKRKAEPIAKVSDLGRSRDLKEPARLSVQDYLAGRGDLRFAPPEFLRWQGEETPQAHKCADLYGLGSLLFELATGVGITHLALGFGPTLIRQTLTDRRRGGMIDLSTLRPRYDSAYNLFASALRMSRVPWNFGGGPLIVRPR